MINYQLISDSINYYEKKGFSRIESPWTVTEKVSAITKPEDRIDFKLEHNGKVLVASGEQSFLYLYLKNFLPKGRYQTVTPCYRYESFDFLHTKYFMKNELIITDKVNNKELNKLVDDAMEFFIKYLDKEHIKVVETKDGFDINYKEYELGSYGIRECEFLRWIYGTGLAEPRFSKIVNLQNGLS